MGDCGRVAPAPARAPVSIDYHMPAADLARLVSSYYIFSCDLPELADIARAEIGQLRFAIAGGGRYVFTGAAPIDSPEIALTGPTLSAARIETRGPTQVFGIGLLPAGWAALIGLEAHLYRDRVVDGGEILGGVARSILGRLRQATSARQMLALADAFVRHLDAHGQEPPFWFTDTVDGWLTADASPDVDTLVAATGLSSRHVERLCNRIYGAPPKLLARKYRALRAAARIAAGEDWRMLYEGTFYDQSHAIREFKRFIGMTPTQLVQSRSPLAQMTFAQRARLEKLPALIRVS